MILSDRDIKKYLKKGIISISPLPNLSDQLGSCSIDLRLGDSFRLFEHSRFPFIDTADPKLSEDITTLIKVKKGEPFILQPGDFVLATTMEKIILPDNLLARLEGRSSLGRLGIVVHSTASIFEPGYRGKIVMEMGNLARIPVALYSGMRVCALTFEELTTSADVPYNKKKQAKYMNQDSPVASKISSDKS